MRSRFNEAIPIAFLGLVVNVASVRLLSGGGHDHGHGHGRSHHDHAHDEAEEHEHSHGVAHRDNNMRAAIIHVLADAAVSVLVIVGLLLGRFLGWTWMDPVAGLGGAVVIAARSYGLVRDTGAILLDMTPDHGMADRLQALVEADGDRLTDLHLWRLGPGHLAAILSIATRQRRGPEYYQSLLGQFPTISHATVQVQNQ